MGGRGFGLLFDDESDTVCNGGNGDADLGNEQEPAGHRRRRRGCGVQDPVQRHLQIRVPVCAEEPMTMMMIRSSMEPSVDGQAG